MLRYILKIDGMMCGMCESHMNDAIRNNFVIEKVTSSHTAGETIVICRDELDEEKIAKVVTEMGYKLLGVSKEPYQKKSFFAKLFKK